MKPSEKGWLKKYLSFHYQMESYNNFVGLSKNPAFQVNPDRFIYSLIQPTGLMYGHPVKLPVTVHKKIDRLDEKEKMRILLADSFLTGSFYLNKDYIENDKDRKDALEEMIRDVSGFYRLVFPGLSKKSRSGLFGRRRKQVDQVESLINSRTDLKTRWDKDFWTSFFHNSLLFLDFYFYIEWKKGERQFKYADLANQHTQSRILILKVIAAAAYANKSIEKEERKLFEYFLHSAHLPADKEKEVARLIDEQLDLADIDLGQLDSWIIKKYVLELAILTVWADKQLEESEAKFIEQLVKKLGFSSQETEESMLAIESFVLENWESIHYLQGKENYKIVSERFVKSMRRLLEFYKNSIVKEIHESKELMVLLNKSMTKELTDIEKEKVRQQLVDILKALPLFAIIALPGRTLTLPILFKILPKNALPSAFQE